MQIFKRSPKLLRRYIEGRVHPCGGTGWRHAIFLDMTHPNEVCPERFILLPDGYTNELVVASVLIATFVFAFFDVSEAYREVCGRVKVFQKGGGSAFRGANQLFREGYVHGFGVGYEQFCAHLYICS